MGREKLLTSFSSKGDEMYIEKYQLNEQRQIKTKRREYLFHVFFFLNKLQNLLSQHVTEAKNENSSPKGRSRFRVNGLTDLLAP